MRVALASREIAPLGGGGIGQFVAACARLLAAVAEVTIFTTAALRPHYEALRQAGDPRLPPDSVRIVFVPEPTAEQTEAGPWLHIMHRYSADLYAALRDAYPAGGPDLIEFPDYLGEGAVTVQAAQSLDPFLADTRILVRVHTSGEICAVLNGEGRPDRRAAALYDLERMALAGADRLLWQGGAILDTYRRFYGAGSLAPAVQVRYPYDGAHAGPDPGFACEARALRVLYAGRLERRKGLLELINALTGLGRDDVRLTVIGADTPTAPLGQSMREVLELMVADDGRVSLREAVPRDRLAELIRAHDLAVVPSRWECWPYAALEALHLNRPVLATPVGGLVELVREGASGWLSAEPGAPALQTALERALDDRPSLAAMIRAGTPAAHGSALADGRGILEAYTALARCALARPVARPRRPGARPRPQAERPAPLVSAIVPYHRSARFVRETVDSLLAQTHPRIEIVLVNDGSFEEDDWVLAELAARTPVSVVSQMNHGLGAARNFGVLQSRGRYFFPLDADNTVEPEFVARAVEILERRPDVAYVTAWSRYIDHRGAPLADADTGYRPLGNRAELTDVDNVAGDAAAVIPRRLFDAGYRYSEELTSYEDWALYRRLRAAGKFGVVIPERLIRYRVHLESMTLATALPNRERLLGEIDAHLRECAVQWT